MSFQNPVFIPGPTNIPEALRKACDMPTIDHRSPLFASILHPARDGVRKVLKSDTAEIFIFPATGTGGWETAITNTLSPGDKVLAARNGMFSQKWIDMCQRHGLDVEFVEVPWGQGIPVDRFEEILTADTGHEIKAVLATHNETATGVRSDIGGVRKAMDTAGHPAMLFVDGVSSIGSMDFRFDEWGVDVAVAGSQKGFMLPAGLAIVGFSPRAAAASDTATLPRTFFDIRDMSKGYANDAYPYTPAVGLLNGCPGLGYGAVRCVARSLFGHRQRDPDAQGLQRVGHRFPCRQGLWRGLWHGARRCRRQGFPHWPPG